MAISDIEFLARLLFAAMVAAMMIAVMYVCTLVCAEVDSDLIQPEEEWYYERVNQ